MREINPLDAILVEFVSDDGWPLAIAASRIRRISGFVSSLSVDGYSVAVREGASLFCDGENSPASGTMLPLRGTYAENLAIWRKALEPVAALMRPKWLVPRDPWNCAKCAKPLSVTNMPGEIVLTICDECAK